MHGPTIKNLAEVVQSIYHQVEIKSRFLSIDWSPACSEVCGKFVKKIDIHHQRSLSSTDFGLTGF